MGTPLWVGLSLLLFSALCWRAGRPLAHGLVARSERETGVESVYLHEIIDESLLAFVVFAAVLPFSRFRRRVPAACWHAARIVATRSADCGACLQMTVNLALVDGLSVDLAQAIVNGNALPDEVADVVSFTERIMRHEYDEGELRERLVRRYGQRGLIDLAYAIASSQVFPYTKKVLGHGIACAKVQIQLAGGSAAPAHTVGN